ncbi:hypothetical protein ACHAWU_006768 [Discostella pseudostelligera]|uniref:Uncharacterized protein n=1 Tax=Discostella pseudostelligera TaxID=259834 RepID=A0ABD3M4D0_9STRA
MSLSTVIQDLEAEGASYVTTATFLTSKSVRKAQCESLLCSLFGVSTAKKGGDASTASGGGDDDDVEVKYGVTMAFGKKLAGTAAAAAAAAGGESKGEADENGIGGSGVAIACPPCTSRSGASVSEICATVVACGGSVVYVADSVDLGRGEGLFHHLGPALERLLAFRSQRVGASSTDGQDEASALSSTHRPSTLIVVMNGVKDEREMKAARKQWESAASQMLSSIIQPSRGMLPKATKLEDIFDRIEYLSSSETDVEKHLCPAGGSVSSPSSPSARGPSEVASSVSDVVNAGLVEDLGPVVELASKVPVKQKCIRLTNPIDLAAARVLGPIAQSALKECLDTVHSSTGLDGSTLVPEFGALCDASIRRALDTFDTAIGSTFKKSTIAKRIRSDLQENLYSEMGDIYELQVAALKEYAFANFRAKLNKLRISPNLPDLMKEAAESSLAEFALAVKKLRRVSHATSYGSWMTNADQITSLKHQFAEHNAERLKAARASGQFKPVPRKGVTLGFHWLLPKPFGNDYRQEPHLTHTADDLVYAPVDGITDVAGVDIKSGDWRKGVVPAPSGGEMMYLK